MHLYDLLHGWGLHLLVVLQLRSKNIPPLFAIRVTLGVVGKGSPKTPSRLLRLLFGFPQRPRPRSASTSRAWRPEDEHCPRPALRSLRTHLASRREAPVGVWVEGEPPLGMGAFDAEQIAKQEEVPENRALGASRCAWRRRLRRDRDSDGVELEPQALQAGPVACTLLCKGMQEDKHAIRVRLATT